LGDKAILKYRIPKRYRHPDLDRKIIHERLLSEGKLMVRARKCGVNVPFVLHVDTERKHIIMQYVDGHKLKDYL